MLSSHRRRRPWRMAAYTVLGAAGVILLVDPTRNIAPLPWWIRWLCSSSLVIGALFSFWGSLRDRWLGEFSGLPLLFSPMLAIFIILVAGEGSTGRLAFACFTAYVFVTLVGRWMALWEFVDKSTRAEKERR